MALVVKDRVRETSTTAGTGALTLNGAVSGFQSFSVIGDGNTTYYTIVDAGTGAWEVGIGIYTSATTSLSRDTVLESSNSGSLVNFGSNLKDVFVTYPAERSIYTDAAGTAITPATASVLGVASGGTGQSTYTNGQLLIGNTTGNTLAKSTLTAGTGISITNGTGSITVAATNNGDVVGPASSTDNAIARFDSTTGKIIQNSGVTIDDSNNVSGVAQLNATTVDTTNIEVTNIKAKDGTASASIADSTGVFSHATTTVFPAGAVGTPAITTTGDTNTGIFFPAADTIAFAEGGVEAMRIDSSGNVGVGRTPIVNTSTSILQVSTGVLNGPNSGLFGNLYFDSSSVSWKYAGNGYGGYIKSSGSSTALEFGYASANNVSGAGAAATVAVGMVMNTAGNVGIGTSNTLFNAKLNVGDGVVARVDTAGTTPYFQLYNANAGTNLKTWRLGALSDGNLTLDTVNDAYSSATSRLYITNAGNVGIGTSSPATRLALSGAGTTSTSWTDGDAGGAALVLQDTGGSGNNGGQLLFGAFQGLFAGIKGSLQNGTGPAGDLLFQTRTTSGNIVERMRITSAGNVGIGTNSPSYKLSISGGSATSSNLLLTHNTDSTGAYSRIRFQFAEGNTSIASEIRNIQRAAGENGASLAFFTDSNAGSLTERMRITSAGNVGIGTSSPNTRLSVTAGTDNTVGDSISSAASTVTTQNYNFNTNSNPAAFQVMSNSTLGADVGATIGLGGRYTGTTFAQFAIIKGAKENATDNNFATYLAFGTRANSLNILERMRIDSSGNLLVGGTTGNYKLTVSNGRGGFTGSQNVGSMLTATGGLGGAECLSASASDAAFMSFHRVNAYASYFGIDTDNYFAVGGWSAGAGLANFKCSALSKASGSFKIDHPLPELNETHHLVHSFVEAPQADNIYRGKVELVDGRAEVNIDTNSGMTGGTFVLLNREVQCFTSNESDWDAVRGSVNGNILTIECQNAESTATISWLVIGERQDKHMYDTNWTDENGKVIVEPLKIPTQMEGN
jgi:hypothetical protein